MRPHFNPFPHQVQTGAPRASASQQQVMPPNPCPVNSNNLLPNFLQVQSQIGIINPQISIPFCNSNTHLSNAHVAAMRNAQPPGFMNFANHLLPLQNNHLGMTHLGSAGATPHQVQCHGGFGPQNSVHNMNTVNTFPIQPGQLFAHNSPNIPQHFNQNINVPNGQFCWQNPMQNMNQFVPMQMSNPTQVGPYNVSSGSHHMLGCPNQVAQVMGPQNPAFIANPQFGMVHPSNVGQHVNQNQQLVQSSQDVNSLKQSPITTQLQQTQKNLQPSVFTRPQGNHVKDGGNNISNPNWKNSPSKNFTRNSKRAASHWGSQKSQVHHMKNAKGKFGGFNENRGKGLSNDRAGKSSLDSTNRARVQQKRSLPLNYTVHEIQQWREERKKSYPSKANIEKKLTEKLTNSEAIDREAKLRREQLKEILAKQAELGVEVAEVPSYYLLDSENQVHGRKENNRRMTKKERFQNKYNKRGRYDKKDRFAKKQKLADKDLPNMPSLNTREPTLLQKLLSADIRRDKSHLLQVFKFMMMNSFFKDWPEKSLKFPLVIVKESGHENVVVKEIPSLMGKGASKDTVKTLVENFDEDDDDDNDKKDARVEQKKAHLANGKDIIGDKIEYLEEEEGEIID